jgi:hypothetical protein
MQFFLSLIFLLQSCGPGKLKNSMYEDGSGIIAASGGPGASGEVVRIDLLQALGQVRAVQIDGKPCAVESKTTTHLTCRLSSEISSGWKDVLIVLDKKAYLARGAFAAGPQFWDKRISRQPS